MDALRILVVVVLSFHAAPAWVADAKAPSQGASDLKRLQDWIPKLAGKFRLEGSLEIAGEDGTSERLSIRGQADCRSVRDADRALALVSGVECFMDMAWTPSSAAEGGAPRNASSGQQSATLLYAIDRSGPGIRHLLVDDEGVAEGGTARLQDDMLVSESPCARIKGKCLRKVRITESDRQSLKWEVDLEVDGKRVGGQQLTLNRETVSP